MNLIGNSCVSAFITKLCFKREYSNPFCWSKIGFESMYNLIKYYDTLNFKNVSFERTLDYYTAHIDDKVDVKYIHYIEDNKLPNIVFERSNVKGPNIIEYVSEKYYSRLAKMVEPPTFLLAAGYWQEYYVNDEQIQQLIELNSPYTILISMPKSPHNKISTTRNVKIHNHTFVMGEDGVHRKLANYVSNYYWGLTMSTADLTANLS